MDTSEPDYIIIQELKLINSTTKIQLRLLYYIIFTSIYFYGYSQKSGIKPVSKKFAILPSSIGYTWQGTNNFDFGVQSMYFLKPKTHNNIALVITANYTFINHSGYLTPKTKIKLYKEFKSRKIAWNASIGHSYTNINSQLDHRITPELGISFAFFHLSYGYNFQISKYKDNVTNPNRISLRFGIW